MLSKYWDIGKNEWSLACKKPPLQGCYAAVKAILCVPNMILMSKKGEKRRHLGLGSGEKHF